MKSKISLVYLQSLQSSLLAQIDEGQLYRLRPNLINVAPLDSCICTYKSDFYAIGVKNLMSGPYTISFYFLYPVLQVRFLKIFVCKNINTLDCKSTPLNLSKFTTNINISSMLLLGL